MSPVASTAEVFAAMQQAKTGAAAYTTNFFPVQEKVQTWVEKGELQAEAVGNSVLFFRHDRMVEHLYFCAQSPAALEECLARSSATKAHPVVVDVVGTEEAAEHLAKTLGTAGFRPYAKLVRLARPGQGRVEEVRLPAEMEFGLARLEDAAGILSLLESCFDYRADQLPLGYEIEEAIRAGQIVVIRQRGEIAALVHFETQGFTSTVRYWLVAPAFRAARVGGAILRHYFSLHETVRRFVLWVNAANQNAIEKYRHFGYAADRLVDRVLVNALVSELE